jgi:hypothetical protein
VEEPDGVLHGGQGGGHQGGQPHQLDVLGLYGFQNHLRRHVPAQVHGVIAVVLHHGAHDVLADVVDVPFDTASTVATIREPFFTGAPPFWARELFTVSKTA